MDFDLEFAVIWHGAFIFAVIIGGKELVKPVNASIDAALDVLRPSVVRHF
jgi:hypothetical protein